MYHMYIEVHVMLSWRVLSAQVQCCVTTYWLLLTVSLCLIPSPFHPPKEGPGNETPLWCTHKGSSLVIIKGAVFWLHHCILLFPRLCNLLIQFPLLITVNYPKALWWLSSSQSFFLENKALKSMSLSSGFIAQIGTCFSLKLDEWAAVFAFFFRATWWLRVITLFVGFVSFWAENCSPACKTNIWVSHI